MSLIIEDTNRLNSLANTIINANKSINIATATTTELCEYIENLIPESTHFSSGVIIPATQITIDSMPEVPFNLGYDENGEIVVPDIIFIYQAQPIKDGQTYENASFFTMLCPKLTRTPPEQLNSGVSLFKQTEGNRVAGTIFGANLQYTRLTDNSFFIAPNSKYPFKAQQPIIWMQIKL